jgi:hypothetical protein
MGVFPVSIKLGPHSLVEMGDTVAWCALKPTVVKLVYDFSPADHLTPSPLVIGRPDENFIGGQPGQWPLGQGDPMAAAKQMAKQIYSPLLPDPRIDALEGPNEINPSSYQEMVWYARFLAALGYEINALGKIPVVGAWATGTPEMTMWQYYTPVLSMCQGIGGLLSRHCYGPLDQWHSFRYALDQAEFRKLGYNPTVIISECGEDAPDKPWRQKYNNNIQTYYAGWIKPFMLAINQASYVRGATLFTVGDGHAPKWHDFDVSNTGLLDILRADLKEIQMADTTPAVALFQVHADPLNNYECGKYPGPDMKKAGSMVATWPIDVFKVVVTHSGVWFQVTKDGSLWFRHYDLLTLEP